MPNKNVAFVAGETESEHLISTLADAISTAKWNEYDGKPVSNRWEKVYDIKPDKWVTYQEKQKANVVGKYKHTDGKLYTVYRIPEDILDFKTPGNGSDIVPTPLVDSGGFIYEISDKNNTKTGNKIQVNQLTYQDKSGKNVTVTLPGKLVVNVPDITNPIGYKAYLVEQLRSELDGSIQHVADWNEFHIITEMTSDWNYFLSLPNQSMKVYYGLLPNSGYWYNGYLNLQDVKPFTFTERYYEADITHSTNGITVLKCVPDYPAGVTPDPYYIMFDHPFGQFNYFEVIYGKGFQGVTPAGNSSETYEKACELSTVRLNNKPTIVNQLEAEVAYKRAQQGAGYIAPSHKWAVDIDGVTYLKSPPAHYHYGCDSIQKYLVNKKRRPDYIVQYWISISNNRVNIVLEGDPSPDMDSYYRSFAYIGKTVPFNEQDQLGNFAVTVGMGDLSKEKTGFEISDIKQDANPAYSGFGRYTSNGMYSVSMFKTRSSVLFQAYYPAFVTTLPNYGDVGTLPKELSSLLLERNGFQPSQWTDKYHASPIYLVHQYEGYRGYMEGVVAIDDHNLINMDELVVDTEEPKDPKNPSKGTWTEVYKFFSIKSPVSFFKSSANPTAMTIAILKEVK
ncbi:hypothetical protein NQ117_09520 [Paenibacillus sp. SC116]|uniref:hypothetical protein n=1 Tax=Paenibacillus sp. SC116 TaxID=2968986 RepID=UPI00215AE145|nr:hypothetical protein [Paenibacillus sp. SC116]MCR8843926.1 hypothetical protein [Paenibacillus sp. SC116]